MEIRSLAFPNVTLIEYSEPSQVDLEEPEADPPPPEWVSLCRTTYLRVTNGNLMDWNSTAMRDLYTKGCNCNTIVASNEIENLMCSDHILRHTWWVQCIYIVLFSSIVLLSVGGNLTVIWIVLWHKRMRASITNYFLLNLSISDSSISIFNVCFSFTYNLYYDWYFGPTYCTFNNFMGVAPTSASVFTLMAMSLDRYVAIVYPLSRRRLSRANTIMIIVLIWLAASLCGLPMLLFSRTVQFFFIDGRKDTVCLADNYSDGHAGTSLYFKLYNYFLLIVNYLLPLAVLTLTYIRVGFELWGSQGIGEHRHDERVRTKRKVVKMMITVVSIFMIAWFPYHAYFTMFMEKFAEMNLEYALHIYLNMYFLAMSSTIFNPMIYCWLNTRFRIGFKYAFRWLPCVRITKEEYLESDLHRERFTSRTATTIRRRSDNRSPNGEAASSTASPKRTPDPNRRRTISDVVWSQQFDNSSSPLSEKAELEVALLAKHRRSAGFGTIGGHRKKQLQRREMSVSSATDV